MKMLSFSENSILQWFQIT